jgi:hypothetical protein
MSEPRSAQADVDAMAEITAALKRGGLRVSAAEIANMVEGYRFVRRGLEAIRQRLPKTVEPAPTFDSAAVYRSPEDGDDHVGR